MRQPIAVFKLIGTCVICTICGINPLSAPAQSKPAVKPTSFGEYRKSVDAIDIKKHMISVDDFKKIYDKPNVYILDLRTDLDYKAGHIKGALHLGADIQEEHLRQLVPDQKATIVLYCTNTLYPSRMISLTHPSLPQIISHGYPNVFILENVWHIGLHASNDFQTGPMWESGTTTK